MRKIQRRKPRLAAPRKRALDVGDCSADGARMRRLALLAVSVLALGCAHARVVAAKQRNAEQLNAALDRVMAEEEAAPVSCPPLQLGFESCRDDSPPVTLALCDGTSAVVDVPARRAFGATGTLVSSAGPVTIDWQQRGATGDRTVVYAVKRSGELVRVELAARITDAIEDPAAQAGCPESLPPGPRLPVMLSTRPVRSVSRTYDVVAVTGCR